MNKILQLKRQIEKERLLLKQQVGVRLKHYRTEASMTQEDLAQSTGIERTTVTNIEGGKQSMSIEQLIMFCELFNITPDDMLCL